MKKAKRLLAVLLASLMLFTAAYVPSYAYGNWHVPDTTFNQKYYFSYTNSATWVLDMIDELLADMGMKMTAFELDDMIDDSIGVTLNLITGDGIEIGDYKYLFYGSVHTNALLFAKRDEFSHRNLVKKISFLSRKCEKSSIFLIIQGNLSYKVKIILGEIYLHYKDAAVGNLFFETKSHICQQITDKYGFLVMIYKIKRKSTRII